MGTNQVECSMLPSNFEWLKERFKAGSKDRIKEKRKEKMESVMNDSFGLHSWIEVDMLFPSIKQKRTFVSNSGVVV